MFIENFPRPHKPRQQQADLLEQLQHHWEANDVIILDAPTGSGKSYLAQAVASTIAKNKQTVGILTKDRMLVNQYTDEFPKLAKLKAKRDYPCNMKQNADLAGKFYKKHWKHHRETDKCEGCSEYIRDLKKMRVSMQRPIPTICNMHVHLAHRLYKNVLIVDEAHNLVSFLQELHTQHWWRHKVHFPNHVWDREGVKEWIDSLDQDTIKEHGLEPIAQEVNRRKPQHSFVRELHQWFGKWEERLKMVPFDISTKAPVMWPGKMKMVFLSATMNHKDLERLGLDKRRWVHLSAGSPIPEDNHPILIDNMQNMGYKHQSPKILLKLGQYIADVRNEEEGRGLIHLPYSLAAKLKEQFNPDWLMFHTPQSRLKQFDRWLESPNEEKKVLIASGMTEGIDLKGDRCTWQVIGKIPYPSLADPIIAEWARRDPEAYVWETLKELIQASGRVCRGPTDRGSTRVYDSLFTKLLEKAEEKGLVPLWWDERLRMKA
jgi:Rad3-related DNA helicase